MKNVIDKYAKALNRRVTNYEKENENLPESLIKHFFVSNHNMIVEDINFCQPDLVGLEKYEIWLNE